ncbi:MAG: rod shape-determining protein MreD [Burkholderiales bacterium]
MRQYSIANWRDKRNMWRVIISLGLSLILSTLPIGGLWSTLFPHLAALVLLYWAINAQRLECPLGIAFLVGLIFDWLSGGIYGLHSITFVLVAIVASRQSVYFQTATPIQQILRVFLVFSGIEIGIFGLIELFTYESLIALSDIYRIILTALVWPAMRATLSFTFSRG